MNSASELIKRGRFARRNKVNVDIRGSMVFISGRLGSETSLDASESLAFLQRVKRLRDTADAPVPVHYLMGVVALELIGNSPYNMR